MSFVTYGSEDELIQDTLQQLCVAEYAQKYCSACSSGVGCCTADHSDEDSAVCRLLREKEELREFEEMEQKEAGEQSEVNNVRRKKLTIDLSNEKNLSDGEILKRLLSPLESHLSDEPLEVILEIVDEEDEDSCSDVSSSNKSFKSLREKLRRVSNKNNTPRVAKPLEKNFLKSVNDFSQNSWQYDADICYSPVKEDDDKSFSPLKMCPSYEKANSLINEIEKCFTETSLLVEKTFHEVNMSNIQRDSFDSAYSSSNFSNLIQTSMTESERGSETSDQAICNNKLGHEDMIYGNQQNVTPVFKDYNVGTNSLGICSDVNKTSNEQPKHTFYEYNQNPYNFGGVNPYFEKDIDDLFQECYELSSTEPDYSLNSCLKNLEHLCSQLNKAKENLIYEMKSEYRSTMNNENNDVYGSQASSLDSHECLAFINELIEKKLREKLKQTKFSLGPPLMGLEGKTHKLIAEVIHENETENHINEFKENDFQKISMVNNSKKYNISRRNEETLNCNTLCEEAYETNDVISESTSEMSFNSNTIDSSRYFSSSSNTGNYSGERSNYKYSGSDSSDDGQNTTMSYEETLALYEDNQELQQSLLSILHSLNDIHDNFLSRRRMEMALSQQSSNFIQNHIKEEIKSYAYEFNEDKSPFNPINFNRYEDTTRNNYYRNGENGGSSLRGDCESIEKITQVSDELKNLWLYASTDLKLSQKKPTRTVSFNRGIKRYKELSDYCDEDNFNDYDYIDTSNEKSLSLPNLSAIDVENKRKSPSPNLIDETKTSENDFTNFFVENFKKKVKVENAKSYDVTLNFLRRIIDPSAERKLKNSNQSDFDATKSPLRNYNAFLRTC